MSIATDVFKNSAAGDLTHTPFLQHSARER